MDLQFNENQDYSWEYFTNMTTLAQYLDRTNLINLSKCCKRYRRQLEPIVLENLDLTTWKNNNRTTYNELRNSGKYKKIAGILKTDLGKKLKFAKKVTLDCTINYSFSKKFLKLVPNIKSLRFVENCTDYCNHGIEIAIVIKGLKHLEHVDFQFILVSLSTSYSRKLIFPLSLKSLKTIQHSYFDGSVDRLMIHDTIGCIYTNLYSTSIVSNRMLQNLSYGMPNLLEVKIKDIDNLDKSKLVKFLKANPQLRKLENSFESYNADIFKSILSSKYLEHLYVYYGDFEGIQPNNLPSNYSIRFLKISCNISAPLVIQFINACKILETLDFEHYYSLCDLYWSNFDRNINILKTSCYTFTIYSIGEIDALKLFNQIHIEQYGPVDQFIKNYNIDKLKNYKLVYSNSKYCNLKLIG
jgi:hypothetical protein